MYANVIRELSESLLINEGPLELHSSHFHNKVFKTCDTEELELEDRLHCGEDGELLVEFPEDLSLI